MITKDWNTLDKEVLAPKVNDEVDEMGKEIASTVILLINDAEEMKSAKESVALKCGEIYDNVLSWDDPTRAEQLCSYLPLILLNLFTQKIKIPDNNITDTGYSEEVEVVISKFIEDEMNRAGFKDIFTLGFSAKHQIGIYGDHYMFGVPDIFDNKKKKKKGEKVASFQGLSIGNILFNREATNVFSNSITQNVNRFMITSDHNIYEAEDMFPWITDVALPGNLPLAVDSETDQKTDIQEGYEDKSMQLGYFFDFPNKVFSIRAGSNNAEVPDTRKTGKEFTKAFSMWWRGEQTERPPFANFGLYSKTTGIYHASIIETFYRIAVNEGLLQGFMVNNLLDINNSPMILNVDGTRAVDVLKQLRRARSEMEKGERAVIMPTLNSTDQARPMTQGDVGYLSPNSATDDNERQFAKFDQLIRRMWFDPDYIYSDAQKTLGQTQLDAQGVADTMDNFISSNLDYFEFAVSFVIDRIIKYGNENDDTIFGQNITVDVEGEQVPMKKLTGDKNFTRGMIIGMIKKAKDRMRVNLNSTNGQTFNPFLENEKHKALLALLPEGSPERLRSLSAMSVANGGKALKQGDVQGTAPAPTITPTNNAQVPR